MCADGAICAEMSAVPTELTDYIKGRERDDYNEHEQAGNAHTAVEEATDED